MISYPNNNKALYNPTVICGHRENTFQDPMEAIESYKESTTEEPVNELPIEIQQQFYTQFMQKHSEKWLY